MQPKQALNSWSSCFALPSTGKNHFLKLLLGYSLEAVSASLKCRF